MTRAAETEAPARARILVADDEESMRYFVHKALQRSGYEVQAVPSGDAAVNAYKARRFDVVVLDLKMPGMEGTEVLSVLRQLDPEAQVVLMTAYGTIRSAVAAMKAGAFDYVTKPFEIDELVLLIERALEQRALRRENRDLRSLVDTRSAFAGLVGQSPALRAVFQTIEVLGSSNATVLVTGESGTGKELVARAVHLQSGRCARPFVTLNCAAVPESLFENELFGHEAGAYTGAEGRKEGYLSRAHGGTLFLDEVAEISPAAQAKLARFIQEREFTPLGASQPVRVDVRIIAATNRDLEEEVRAGRFREELYWRLNVVPIYLPPLRERREDVPALVAHCLERLRAPAIAVRGFTLDAMIQLSNYAWPGNVRELQNTVERLVVLNSDKEILDVTEIPAEIRGFRDATTAARPPVVSLEYEKALGAFEREYLLVLLRESQGNVSQMARLSGISRAQLHRKIRQHDLDVARFRDPTGA